MKTYKADHTAWIASLLIISAATILIKPPELWTVLNSVMILYIIIRGDLK